MDASPDNLKSDVAAKAAFIETLHSEGFTDARVASAPADITATKDGVAWHFELKFTRARGHYFGAATLTEWAAAAADPEHFEFVIAYQVNEQWRFDRYTPEEFMAFSSVPPYKIYFNVPIGKKPAAIRSRLSRKIHLTKARLSLLSRQFEELRSLED